MAHVILTLPTGQVRVKLPLSTMRIHHLSSSLALAVIVVALGMGNLLSAQPVKLPRAQNPVLLFGFEGPEGASA